MPGVGAGLNWSGTRYCGTRSCLVSSKAGRRSRCRVGWPMESGSKVISHESIYRFIYAQMARKKDYSWRYYLPHAKSKRGRRSRKGHSPASFMALRRPITERPQSAADRRTPGHWEADLMLFRTYGHAVLTPPRTPLPHPHCPQTPGKASRPIAQGHVPGVGSVASPMAPDRHLRQRHRVRPPLPSPRPGHPDLLLRYPLPLAEGRCGERHRPAAAYPAPARPTWRHCPRSGSPGCFRPTTSPASAWVTKPRRKSSWIACCT